MEELPVIDTKKSIGSINLSTGEISVSNSEFIYFRCSSTTTCCREPNIPVTDFDIKRIEDHGYELDQIITTSSPVIRFSLDNIGTGERNYWMKKKPYSGSCTFLENNRCSIHVFKPFGCKIFPFQLQHITDDIIKVVVHRSNICKSVLKVSKERANNEIILKNILNIVIEEYSYRSEYLSIYPLKRQNFRKKNQLLS